MVRNYPYFYIFVLAKGKCPLHDHPKLAAIYVYKQASDVEIVRDAVPTLIDKTVIDETHVAIGEGVLSIPVGFSRSVMAVNNYPLIVNKREEAIPLENTPLAEQSSVHTSTKRLLSPLALFLKKCCCCLCTSNLATLDADAASPLLSQSSNVVIQTPQTLPAMPDIPSNQLTENMANETLTQMNEGNWTKKFPKVSISYDQGFI